MKAMFNTRTMYMKLFAASVAVSLVFAGNVRAQEQTPSNAELWEIIQKQQREIDELKRQLGTVKQDVETTSEMVEQVADTSGRGPSWADKTSIGGYGELHYNNLTAQSGERSQGDDKRELDFHRFVLYFGHEFNDRVRLFSEFEIEHALTKDTDDGSGPGEVELEQAYVDIDLLTEDQPLTLRTGLFLIPVGILNETHEPPTFYGVERNNVESKIIPATWWEGGLSIYGEIVPGLRYDLAYTSGLAVGSDYGIRSGRQKVAKAFASDGAYTARLKWNTPGLEIGGTVHYENDITQGKRNGAPERSQGILMEAHTIITSGPFGIRALYAQWDLDADAADLEDGNGKPDPNTALGIGGADKQYGWFIEPSLKLSETVGVFIRYSEWDNGAGDSTNSRFAQVDFGINWWPHENVVLKADYQEQQAPNGEKEQDGINLGVGYQF